MTPDFIYTDTISFLIFDYDGGLDGEARIDEMEKFLFLACILAAASASGFTKIRPDIRKQPINVQPFGSFDVKTKPVRFL